MANNIQEVIQTSLESIRSLVDADTIIGTPIETKAGTTIIPVSKISVGLATGGADSQSVEAKTSNTWGGGGGSGLSIVPIAFLVVSADGKVEIANLGMQQPKDPMDQLASFLEKAPLIAEKFKALFQKNGESADDESDEEAQTDAPAAEAEE